MRITEHRLKHWKAVSETPGVVMLMSERIRDSVDFVWPYHEAGVPFPVLVAMLAWSNRLDERWYFVNGVYSDT